MKRTIIAALTLVLTLAAGTTMLVGDAEAAAAAPGPYEVDGSIGFASGPGNFDAGFGFNLGAGYMLNDIDKSLQARIDLGYFSFSQDVIGATLDYKRWPVTISARYYFPLSDQLKVFGQAGLETSFDKKDSFGFFGKQTKNEVNLGITPGAGVQFFINPQVSVFAVATYHLISDDYFSMQLGGAFHF